MPFGWYLPTAWCLWMQHVFRWLMLAPTVKCRVRQNMLRKNKGQLPLLFLILPGVIYFSILEVTSHLFPASRNLFLVNIQNLIIFLLIIKLSGHLWSMAYISLTVRAKQKCVPTVLNTEPRKICKNSTWKHPKHIRGLTKLSSQYSQSTWRHDWIKHTVVWSVISYS